MYTVKLKHVVGLDTIHTIVYTLHETLNLFPDPPSVYKVLKGLTQSILLFIPYMEPKNPYTDPLSVYKVLKGLK